MEKGFSTSLGTEREPLYCTNVQTAGYNDYPVKGSYSGHDGWMDCTGSYGPHSPPVAAVPIIRIIVGGGSGTPNDLTEKSQKRFETA